MDLDDGVGVPCFLCQLLAPPVAPASGGDSHVFAEPAEAPRGT